MQITRMHVTEVANSLTAKGEGTTFISIVEGIANDCSGEHLAISNKMKQDLTPLEIRSIQIYQFLPGDEFKDVHCSAVYYSNIVGFTVHSKSIC